MLHDEEKYFEAPTRFRLAFREYGTCLGVHCLLSQASAEASSDEEKRYWSALLDEVHGAWHPSVERDPPLVPRKLQPITLVMYAAALYPGGKRVHE